MRKKQIDLLVPGKYFAFEDVDGIVPFRCNTRPNKTW
jgi:hypothetical protein